MNDKTTIKKVISTKETKDIEWKIIGWITENNSMIIECKNSFKPEVECVIERLRILGVITVKDEENKNPIMICKLLRKIPALEK